MRDFLALLAQALVRAVLLLALMGLAPAAHADAPRPAPGVFKCMGERGTPVYQGLPCPPGGELRDLVADPASVSIVEMPVRGPPSVAGAPSARRERSPPRAPATKTRQVSGDPLERRHVRDGMSEGEVLAKLGAPDVTAGKHGRRARWTYLPAPGDPQTVTTIRFEDGRVAGVERTLVR